MRTKAILTINLLLLVLLATDTMAQQVEFNYNGVVKVQGESFDGEGQFKFSIVDKTGQTTFWSNDGASLDGSEPTSPVLVTVVDGFFSVNIGDTETTGTMAPLYAAMFNARDRVKLRTWFSDGIGDFERLRPDREITNPAILGSQSHRETHLYVNAATGNDENTGLQADKAKQTIQSAWDALPGLIQTTATISLADGVYREEVLLTGKTTVGNARVVLLGNLGSPDATRITGSDEGADTTPVRESGLRLINQSGVLIEGVLVDYCIYDGIFIGQGAEGIIRDSYLQHNDCGVRFRGASRATLTRLTITHGSPSLGTIGVGMQQMSYASVNDCTISTQGNGISITQNSVVYIEEIDIDDCYYGVYAGLSALVYYVWDAGPSVVSNCDYGARARYNTILARPERNMTYTNCGVDVTADDTSIIID